MRARQVIDATGVDGTIRSAQGGVEIQGNRVPLVDVAVLMLGNRTAITGGALSLLARYDVVVLNCDWRSVPDMVAYSWIDNSRVATRHRMQAELSKPRRNQAWKSIVRAKVLGQQRNLAMLGAPEAKQLARLHSEVRSGDTSNCEAQAARIYWQAFYGEEFRRIPGSVDRVNSLLNYGYAVMRGFVIQSICIAGLWPSYGIWHRNRSNMFTLADDLIEPFRPALDFCVHLLPPDAAVDDRATKRALVAATSQAMDSSGASVLTRMLELTTSLAYFIEGERDTLEVPLWSPASIREQGGGG